MLTFILMILLCGLIVVKIRESRAVRKSYRSRNSRVRRRRKEQQTRQNVSFALMLILIGLLLISVAS